MKSDETSHGITGGGTSSQEAPLSPLQKLLRHDLVASLIVFLIAIPLSLGIAQASGAPILAGLIAAAVGGIVVGLLGGSPLQVSGPAAGLTVVVYGLVQQFGWPVTCAIVVGAGLLQITFGVLKIARGALAISPAVVHGMLAGIGVTIALAQMHIVLGAAKPESSALKNILALPGQIASLHGPATLLGLLTLGVIFVWPLLPKRIQKVPAPLVAVVGVTLLSVVLGMDVRRVELPANIFSSFTFTPRLPDQAHLGAFIGAIFTVALIASVESLLSAVAVDKLHSGARSNLDRELIGQGAANTISGLLGGLPITGVIVRSSANVAAGAKSKASAILHGIWIILFVAVGAALISKIPYAVLAGLLVSVGVRLVNPGHIREMIHHREWPIYFVTLLGVVFLNLLYGVGLGVGLAVILLLRRLAMVRVTVEERGDRQHVRIEGSMSFIAVPQLTAALGRIPAGKDVDVDLMVDFMDHAAFEALHSWRVSQEKTGGSVDIDELHEAWYESAERGHPRKHKSSLQVAAPATVRHGDGRSPLAQDVFAAAEQ